MNICIPETNMAPEVQAENHKDTHLNQASIFRCKFAVSFRDCIYTYIYIYLHSQQHEHKIMVMNPLAEIKYVM